MIYIWNVPIVATVEEIVRDIKMELHGTGLLREIRNVGDNIMITCPFHANGQERKPSFGLSKKEIIRNGRVFEAGTAHCYTCGYKADLPKFIADVLGFETKQHGMKWLREHYLYGAGRVREELELDLSRNKKKDDGVKFSPTLVTYYHEELKKSSRAISYLQNRRLSNMDILEMFGVGYDPEKDMIVFPVFDLNGQVRMLKKRSIEGKRFDNTQGADKARLVFGLYQLKMYGDPNKPVWLCESETDALTVWMYGGQAVAQMGSHLSDAQMKAVCKVRNRIYYDGLDRDEAGRKGWRAFKDKAIPLGFRLWNTDGFGDKNDINELTFSEFQKIKVY